MKYYFLIALALCFVFFSSAQKTHIPDVAFRNYIAGIAPAAIVGDSMYINDPTISNIDTVDITGLGVSSIKGIEYFSSLKSLNASWNNIGTIVALPSSMKGVYAAGYINLSHNLISQISDYVNAQLMEVRNVDLSYCYLAKISSIYGQARPLWGVADISYNRLDSINFVNTYISKLNCSYNNLNYIRVVDNTIYQADIDCSHNQIVNGSSIFLSGAINSLNCSYNALSSSAIHPYNIIAVDYSHNLFTTCPNFVSGIKKIDVSYNDITVLNNLPNNLEALSCVGNNLLCLPTLPNTLQTLASAQNYISCLPNLPTYPAFNADVAQSGSSYNVCTNSTCNNYAFAHGYLFIDNNGNAIYDAGDSPLAGHFVKISPFTATTFTDSAGYYTLPVQPGIQQVITASPYVSSSISPTSIPIVADAGIDTGGFSFAYTVNSQFPDVQLSITQVMPAVTGAVTEFDVKLKNAGTNIQSGEVTVAIPYIFNYSASEPTASYVSADTIKWAYTNLQPGAEMLYKLNLITGGNVGTAFSISANGVTLGVDSLPQNNIAGISDTVAGTYQGNRKSVLPVNYTSANMQAGDYFDYTIRFKNTGNAIAENVVIIDTLDARFDVTTMQIVASSHNYALLINGNVVRVNYIGINLPAEASDTALSHGFFRFKIRPSANTVFTGTIKNKAYIYFKASGCVCNDSNLSGYTLYTSECGTSTCLKPFSLYVSETDIAYYTCHDTVPGKARAITSPTGIYSYTWSNGNTQDSITVHIPGEYYVTVSNSCNATAIGTALIYNAPGNDIFMQFDSIGPSCNAANVGVSNNGMASISACGTEPLTYKWSTGSTNDTIFNLTAGTYYCTVTNAFGATKVGSVKVVAPLPITNTYLIDSCAGIVYLHNVVGGTGIKTYLWDNGTTELSRYTPYDAYYNYVITDQNQCKKNGIVQGYNFYGENYNMYNLSNKFERIACEDSFILTLNSYSNVNMSDWHGNPQPGTRDIVLLYENVYYRTVDLYPTGQPYRFIVPFTTGNSAYFLDIAYYTDITVANFESCRKVLTINGPTFTPTVKLNVVGSTQPSCTGLSNGNITVAAQHGEPSYRYLWSNGDTTSTISNLSAGTYSCTVTDSIGCTAVKTIQLTQPAVLNANITLANDTVCYGATGSISTSVTGGTLPYTYSWAHGATTANVSNLLPAVYTCVVTDSKGCKDTVSAALNQYGSSMAVHLEWRDISCYGGNNGYAKLVVTDGEPGYSYLWSNGNTIAYNDSLQVGTYTYTVTDANSCIAIGSVAIGSPMPLSATITSEQPFCHGDSTGSIMLTAHGGTPLYTYLWGTGATDSVLANVQEGIYSYIVIDSNTCKVAGTYFLSQPDDILVSVTMLENPLCHGGSNGVIKIQPMGGNAPYQYLWSNGSTSANLTALPQGTYTCSITDANGCGSYRTYALTEPDSLIVNVEMIDSMCYNKAEGEIHLSATGGTAPYVYIPQQNMQGLMAGEYIYTVADTKGCVASGAVTVNERPNLLLYVNTTAETLCGRADGRAQAGSMDGLVRLQWSNGDSATSISNLQAGTYSVTATDVNGCTATQPFTITCATSIAEINLGEIRIYPNPAKDVVYIEFEDNANYGISLMDIQGRLMYMGQADSNTRIAQLAVGSYAKGVYVLEISTKGSRRNEKLVIE